MKISNLKNWGITGRQVTFNLMDCYEASHMHERINALLSGKKSREDGLCELNDDGISEALTLLEMADALVTKIAINPSEMPTIFDPAEEEPAQEEC